MLSSLQVELVSITLAAITNKALNFSDFHKTHFSELTGAPG